MKKFSKITGEKISDQPKIIEKKITEKDMLMFGIKKLMDNYLAVQMYGPITRYHVAGTMKVVGKEIFLEALMNLLEESNTKEGIKLLESLKLESKNWEFLDNKIDELNNIAKNISDGKLVPHKEKIKKLYNRYRNSELIPQFEKSISKINNSKTAYERGLAAKSLTLDPDFNSNFMEEISNRYFNRAIELNS